MIKKCRQYKKGMVGENGEIMSVERKERTRQTQ
jgi:hypothetical protein